MVYVRGWRTLSRLTPGVFSQRRLSTFLAGLGVLWLALASPIDAFDPFLLADHMLQHLLLMVVAPPLILLGAPALPLLHGLPRWAVRDGLGPFLSWPPLGRLGHILTHPAVCWLLMAVAMLGWHVPAAYELALRSPGWHDVEHACFFVTSVLFWWPVIQPWPSRPQWPQWTIPLYLLLGDFVNSALSAFLAFCDRVLYPTYLAVPRLFGISALNDQVAAGAIMWVIGSFAFVVPAVVITVRLLSPRPALTEAKRTLPPPPSPLLSPDLGVLGASDRGSSGSFRYGHRTAQAALMALVLAAIAYGVFAPADLDDGGVVSVNEPAGLFRITVFTAPASPRCGPVGVSVLVQDLASGRAFLDATVDVRLQSRQGTAGTTIRARATQDESANKLLQSATLDVPSPGPWELRVSVLRGQEEGAVAAGLEVEQAATIVASLWPYLLLLLCSAGVLALHHALRRDARQLAPVKQG
jgi:putative membrane protein